MRDDAPCSQIPAEAARHPRRCARWCDDHRGLARNAAPELGMTPAVSSQRWRRRLLSASLTLLAFLAFGAGVAIFVWRLTSLQPPPAVGHSSFKKAGDSRAIPTDFYRSEEHTSELQSLRHLVCRLLLEKTGYLYIPLSLHRPYMTPLSGTAFADVC